MVKAIAYAKVKSDKLDARMLADLLRAGMIPESYVPGKDIRRARARDYFVVLFSARARGYFIVANVASLELELIPHQRIRS